MMSAVNNSKSMIEFLDTVLVCAYGVCACIACGKRRMFGSELVADAKVFVYMQDA